MMRATFAFALTLALLAPTAQAARGSISLDGPETVSAWTGFADAQMTLVLEVEDFYCPEDRTFVVTLGAQADPGITVDLPPEVVFQVPADSYLIRPFVANSTFNVGVAASQAGSVVVSARFEAAEGSCITAGGFPSTQTATTIRVETTTDVIPPPMDARPPPEPSPAPKPAPTPPANETEIAENSTNETSEPPTPTPAPAQPTTCKPSPTCGFIGEFDPGTETVDESALETPFLGVMALAVALVLATVLARKR